MNKNKAFEIGLYILTVVIIGFIITLASNVGLMKKLLGATAGESTESYYVGMVNEVEEASEEEVAEKDIILDPTGENYKLTIQVQEIDEEVEAFVSSNDLAYFNGEGDFYYQTGDRVIVFQSEFGGENYFVLDKFRLPNALMLIVGFILIGFIFIGTRAISSFIGLIITIAVLVGYIVPSIISGQNPIVVSLIGAMLIAFTSLYFAHGFNVRTTLALISTIITIIISLILAIITVNITNLNGLGSEEVVFIVSSLNSEINLKGLLLGGIIIGALGVLDDITTAQTAIVAELKEANKKLTTGELYRRAFSVGKEHISSLVNTLVLAYAGSAFPLFILITTSETTPYWVTFSKEFIVEELARSIVGSITLIAAVPISTIIAAWWFNRKGKRQ